MQVKDLTNSKAIETQHIYRQINDNEYIYVSNFDPKTRRGNNFTLEHFEGNKLAYKISASAIRYVEKDTTYSLTNYNLRIIGNDNDKLEYLRRKDTLFSFDLEDLTPPKYVAETLTYGELIRFISREEVRGSNNINRYKVVQYKKWSLPVSVFILTIIAVAVSSIKRRGGMGVNLAFGISLGFLFIFFDKIFSVLVNKSNFSPFLGAWLPILIFGGLATFLLRSARR